MKGGQILSLGIYDFSYEVGERMLARYAVPVTVCQ